MKPTLSRTLKPAAATVFLTVLAATAASHPAAADPLTDVDQMAHCAMRLSEDGVGLLGPPQNFVAHTVNPYLAYLENLDQRTVEHAKCAIWHNLCLKDGQYVGSLAYDQRNQVCRIVSGAGIVNDNPCYTVVHDESLAPATQPLGYGRGTYYIGYGDSYYGLYYARYGYDYPSWEIPPHACDASWWHGMWCESNGLPGLQPMKIDIGGGRVYDPDRWCASFYPL